MWHHGAPALLWRARSARYSGVMMIAIDVFASTHQHHVLQIPRRCGCVGHASTSRSRRGALAPLDPRCRPPSAACARSPEGRSSRPPSRGCGRTRCAGSGSASSACAACTSWSRSTGCTWCRRSDGSCDATSASKAWCGVAVVCQLLQRRCCTAKSPRRTCCIRMHLTRVPQGAKLQCQECYVAFHPICARLAGLEMRVTEVGPDLPPRISTLCHRHGSVQPHLSGTLLLFT